MPSSTRQSVNHHEDQLMHSELPSPTAEKRGIGLTWKNLHVGTDPSIQFERLLRRKSAQSHNETSILKGLEGVLLSGEMLLVLGKPGSGCTTFLKTLAGHTDGLRIKAGSRVSYRGHEKRDLAGIVRGKRAYVAEDDIHFPHLSVRETLNFAVKISNSDLSSNTEAYLSSYMNSLRLSQATDTQVGNDMIPGCSGGERKRISIAEVLVSDCLVQCWDNPTRGLDSENASLFIKTLRQHCNSSGCIAVVTLYQASEEIFKAFDKVLLLYEGTQVYWGTGESAKEYFHDLGFIPTVRIATNEFLTSITHSPERRLREGFENRAPDTPEQFRTIWQSSLERAQMLEAVQRCETALPVNLDSQSQSRQAYRKPYGEQISMCLARCVNRLRKNLTPGISAIIGNLVLSIILGSIFFNMSETSDSFYSRGALIFFMSLTNTWSGAFEAVQLWEHRPIVEKQKLYGFYHPSAEAVASIIASMPEKLLVTLAFNIPCYFLANLRRTVKACLIFYLFSFLSLLTGSMLFRALGAISKTVPSSIAPASNLMLLLVIFTGFVLPIPMMPSWLGWVRYINPIGYGFESLMLNEFSGRTFVCSSFVPGTTKCAMGVAGDGTGTIEGTEYLRQTYAYNADNLWKNLAWIIIIMIVLFAVYLIASEYISMVTRRPHGEVIPRKDRKYASREIWKDEEAHVPKIREEIRAKATSPQRSLEKLSCYETQQKTFIWRNITCTVEKQKKESVNSKAILHGIDGWTKPGTLTALMGASGAGKTTLLNILAGRPSVGVVSGTKDMSAVYRDDSFTRKVGYAQQQDIHLPTMTVKEAFEFSALLRQPEIYSRSEKLLFVDEIIEELDLYSIQHTIIGGLNIAQQKRVTIGVELVARPELLLFLDEPTSGMDSNTAWLICKLLRRLCDNGQTILCTIHQPSANLFQMFDRLLLLQHGKTIYFGDIGRDCSDVVAYFERKGARPCKPTENPAEWMLTVTEDTEQIWSDMWLHSEENRVSQTRLDEFEDSSRSNLANPCTKVDAQEFAASFWSQLRFVSIRNLIHDWRTPDYLSSKIWLTLGSGLINGISFYKSPFNFQGVQNQLFSIFVVCVLHSSLVQIILPQYFDKRALFEARERLSKTYSWKVFIIANFIAELPCQAVLAVIQFVTWYFPVGSYQHHDFESQRHERASLMFLATWSFTLFSVTFSLLIATFAPDPATGINISASLWSLCLILCGILVSPSALPRFWIWMYRVSPVTYLVNTMAAVGLAGAKITCTSLEVIVVTPPLNRTCSDFLTDQLLISGGMLMNPAATESCEICPVATTNKLLANFKIDYLHRWRSFGISLVFPLANIIGALLLYRLIWVKKRGSKRTN